ncbi:hypothetical protein U8V72_15055 [Priestia filamentosa]|uniref:hypothetical protein n=1 Tax=Priestia filamentosa TaxID=1402861 RepID=UPI00397A80A7
METNKSLYRLKQELLRKMRAGETLYESDDIKDLIVRLSPVRQDSDAFYSNPLLELWETALVLNIEQLNYLFCYEEEITQVKEAAMEGIIKAFKEYVQVFLGPHLMKKEVYEKERFKYIEMYHKSPCSFSKEDETQLYKYFKNLIEKSSSYIFKYGEDKKCFYITNSELTLKKSNYLLFNFFLVGMSIFSFYNTTISKSIYEHWLFNLQIGLSPEQKEIYKKSRYKPFSDFILSYYITNSVEDLQRGKAPTCTEEIINFYNYLEQIREVESLHKIYQVRDFVELIKTCTPLEKLFPSFAQDYRKIFKLHDSVNWDNIASSFTQNKEILV